MYVGLDFGTTNSSVSIYDGSTVTLLPLDPFSANPRVMRTTLFVARGGTDRKPEPGERFIGREAINRFTQANVGRTIEYAWQDFGKTELLDGNGAVIFQSIGALIDQNIPGRLFQSLKSHLRDSDFVDTNVFGTPYRIEELIAIVIRMIVDRIEVILGNKVTRMVIGRPVHYSHNPDHDQIAIDRMREACQLAALPAFAFLPEPNAAAVAYARTAPADQRALVFDFGGGTLDVTIITTDGKGGSRVLSNDGVPVGGDVMDQRIMMGKLLSHFGVESKIGRQRMPFPAAISDRLSEWQSIFELSHPKYMPVIEDLLHTSTQPELVAQLKVLVNQNYGLPLFEAVEQAKVRLSNDERTNVSMHVPGIDIEQLIERWDFERLIGPDIRTVAACIDRAVAAANLSHNDINVVLRTGGSSRIPAFVRMLTQRLGSAAMVEMDPFTGGSQGLVIAAADDAFFAQLQK